jgi:hypothetical protein
MGTKSQAYELTKIPFYANHSNLSVLSLNEHYGIGIVRRMLKQQVFSLESTHNFKSSSFLWHYTSLLQFFENMTGRKTLLNFGPFIETALTIFDRAKCRMWGNRLSGFHKVLGAKIFTYEALEVLIISLRLKDPTFLAN